jgi:hypothetical protein
MSVFRSTPLLVLLLSACASMPRSQGLHQAKLEGFGVGEIREAARIVVEEVAHRWSVVRITEEGSVLTEGWIGVCGEQVTCRTRTGHPGGSAGTPWTTIEVRFRELGTDTAVEVEVVYEDCAPGVTCQPQRLASTGVLERRILDGIRERLESPAEDSLTEL